MHSEDPSITIEVQEELVAAVLRYKRMYRQWFSILLNELQLQSVIDRTPGSIPFLNWRNPKTDDSLLRGIRKTNDSLAIFYRLRNSRKTKASANLNPPLVVDIIHVIPFEEQSVECYFIKKCLLWGFGIDVIKGGKNKCRLNIHDLHIPDSLIKGDVKVFVRGFIISHYLDRHTRRQSGIDFRWACKLLPGVLYEGLTAFQQLNTQEQRSMRHFCVMIT